MYNVEIANTAYKRLDILEVHFRGPFGSNQGPWLILDPMGIKTCVPRVPQNVFCYLVYKI